MDIWPLVTGCHIYTLNGPTRYMFCNNAFLSSPQCIRHHKCNYFPITCCPRNIQLEQWTYELMCLEMWNPSQQMMSPWFSQLLVSMIMSTRFPPAMFIKKLPILKQYCKTSKNSSINCSMITPVLLHKYSVGKIMFKSWIVSLHLNQSWLFLSKESNSFLIIIPSGKVASFWPTVIHIHYINSKLHWLYLAMNSWTRPGNSLVLL